MTLGKKLVVTLCVMTSLNACSGSSHNEAVYKQALACHTQVMSLFASSNVYAQLNGGNAVNLEKEMNIARNGAYQAGGAAGHSYREVTNDIMKATDVEGNRLKLLSPDGLSAELDKAKTALSCLKQYTTET